MTVRADQGAVPSFPFTPATYTPRNETEFRRIVRLAIQDIMERSVRQGGLFALPNFSDSDRPGAGSVDPGTAIWNTDDAQLNISDGTNWTLPDGTTT